MHVYCHLELLNFGIICYTVRGNEYSLPSCLLMIFDYDHIIYLSTENPAGQKLRSVSWSTSVLHSCGFGYHR